MNGPSGSFVDSDLPGSQGRLAFAALVALERCEQILTDQLGVAPSPETQQLALTLRS
jgi:hypothetical protein